MSRTNADRFALLCYALGGLQFGWFVPEIAIEPLVTTSRLLYAAFLRPLVLAPAYFLNLGSGVVDLATIASGGALLLTGYLIREERSTAALSFGYRLFAASLLALLAYWVQIPGWMDIEGPIVLHGVVLIFGMGLARSSTVIGVSDPDSVDRGSSGISTGGTSTESSPSSSSSSSPSSSGGGATRGTAAEQGPAGERDVGGGEEGRPQDDPLTAIGGIGESKAATLRGHGFETVADLRDASRATLADVPGIGEELAARIEAEAGGSETTGKGSVGPETEGTPTGPAKDEYHDDPEEEGDAGDIEDQADTSTNATTGAVASGAEDGEAPEGTGDDAVSGDEASTMEDGEHGVIAALLEVSRPGEVTPAHVEELTASLESDDPDERRQAAEALGAVGARDPSLVDPATDDLGSLRLDTDIEVSEAAREALDRIKDARR